MYSNNDELVKEWTGIIESLWIAVGKDPDVERMKLYAKNLASVPMGLLQAGVTRAIRENGKYQTVPTISAIWTAISKELGDPPDLESAIERWVDNSFEKCIVRF